MSRKCTYMFSNTYKKLSFFALEKDATNLCRTINVKLSRKMYPSTSIDILVGCLDLQYKIDETFSLLVNIIHRFLCFLR